MSHVPTPRWELNTPSSSEMSHQHPSPSATGHLTLPWSSIPADLLTHLPIAFLWCEILPATPVVAIQPWLRPRDHGVSTLVQARGVLLLPIIICIKPSSLYPGRLMSLFLNRGWNLDTPEYELSGLGSSLSLQRPTLHVRAPRNDAKRKVQSLKLLMILMHNRSDKMHRAQAWR